MAFGDEQQTSFGPRPQHFIPRTSAAAEQRLVTYLNREFMLQRERTARIQARQAGLKQAAQLGAL